MVRTDRPRPTPQGKYARSGYTSPIDAALQLIGGKYKVAILYHLRASVIRFGELRRLMPSATARMLTKQLRELERDGMIRAKCSVRCRPGLTTFSQERGGASCPSSRHCVNGVSGGSDILSGNRPPAPTGQDPSLRCCLARERGRL
jgi:hypothetical protein